MVGITQSIQTPDLDILSSLAELKKQTEELHHVRTDVFELRSKLSHEKDVADELAYERNVLIVEKRRLVQRLMEVNYDLETVSWIIRFEKELSV